MAALNAQQIAESWGSGMNSGGQKWLQGVNGVTESPMAKAATPQAMADYVSGVQRSVDSGKRQASLMKGSADSWKQACATAGTGAMARGAAKGKAKYIAWLNNGGAAAMANAKAAAAAITGPKGDMGTALAKVQAAMTAMQASKKSG